MRKKKERKEEVKELKEVNKIKEKKKVSDKTMISIILTMEEKKQFRMACKRERRSMSSQAILLIKRFIENRSDYIE